MRNSIIGVILILCFQLQAQKNPNILFILADDLGWGDVGFNGQDKIKTPNIDAIAKNGMVFNQFYAGNPVCGPSRATLLTGKHTGHGSVRSNPKWTTNGKPEDIKASEWNVAKVLKAAGYHTGVIGKWGLAENLDEGLPNRQGFDYFYGFNKHMPAHHYYPDSIYENQHRLRIKGNNWRKKEKHYIQDIFTEKAKSFLAKKSDKPFFLYLAYTVPHYELTVPEDSKVSYRKLGWPIRKMKANHYLNDPEGNVTYAGMITRMDKQIGEIVNQLKQQGIYDNTIIVFTSDNGHWHDNPKNEFFNSNGPFRGRKRDLYEGGIRVPMAVQWPNVIKSNSQTEHVAAFWDVMATFADLTNQKIPNKHDGISFLPTMLSENDKQERHSSLYWEFNEIFGPGQALRKDDWKLVKLYKKPVQLFNLKNDPGEKKNLAQAHPEIVKEMLQTLESERTFHPNFTLEKRISPWKKDKNKKKKKNT